MNALRGFFILILGVFVGAGAVFLALRPFAVCVK
jgi:hypothetical protein